MAVLVFTSCDVTVLGHSHCSQCCLQMQLFSVESSKVTCSVSTKQKTDKVSDKLVKDGLAVKRPDVGGD